MNAAFSKTTPKLQLAWDATSIKDVQFCPRYYQHTHLEGYRPDSVHLDFGGFIATGFEKFQKLRLNGATQDEAALAVVRWALEATWNDDDTQWGGRYETMWKCEGTEKYKNSKGNRAVCPFAFKNAWFPGDAPDICVECRSGIKSERIYLPNDNAKNRQSLIRALIGYAYDQPENLDDGLKPYVFPDGTPAVELSGRLPLPFTSVAGEPYILTWNFDYIGDWGSELFVVDNKTTSKTLDSKFFATYNPDTQFDTYDLIASLAYPALDISGTMVDAVQVIVSGVEFGRMPYYRNEKQREEHLRDIEIWIKQAETYALMDYWPMNKRNCWLCPLKGACSLSPEKRPAFLKANFERREPWNPLQVR